MSIAATLCAGARASEATAPASTSLPTITAIEPASGPAGGGTAVTLSGTGFLGATAVRSGETEASSFTVASSTSITALAPPDVGVFNSGSTSSRSGVGVTVTVTTPAGTSARVSYTYLFGLEPESGPTEGGTVVTISGVGFDQATAVDFGQTAASFEIVNDDTIRAVPPPGRCMAQVNVVLSGSQGHLERATPGLPLHSPDHPR